MSETAAAEEMVQVTFWYSGICLHQTMTREQAKQTVLQFMQLRKTDPHASAYLFPVPNGVIDTCDLIAITYANITRPARTEEEMAELFKRQTQLLERSVEMNEQRLRDERRGEDWRSEENA